MQNGYLLKVSVNPISASNLMEVSSKHKAPKWRNPEHRAENFPFLFHKNVCQSFFLTNYFKFICLLNKGLLKPVFIGFMFVFLHLSGNVPVQMHHAFARLKYSSGKMNSLFITSSSETVFSLSRTGQIN